MDVPLEDLLHMLRYRLRALATQRYHTELQVYASIAPYSKKAKAPELPEVLR